MRKPACVACFLAVFAAPSCSTAPVDSVIYRACCGTERHWLGRQWHLTAAEAKAQVELHRREHPEHEVRFVSTAGPVRTDAADTPAAPMRTDAADAPLTLLDFLFMRGR